MAVRNFFKNTALHLCVFALAVSIVGCSKKTDEPVKEAGKESPAESQVKPTDTPLSDTPTNITGKKVVETSIPIEPLVGIGAVKFGMQAGEMKKILGEPKLIEGDTYNYYDAGLIIVTKKGMVNDIMFGDRGGDSMLVNNCKYRTSKDIGMGSSKEDIISAYGDYTSIREIDNTAYLIYRDMGSLFVLIDGKVVHMAFSLP